MKVLSRDFSLKERIGLLILICILVVLVYYQFVHKTVTEGVQNAQSESQSLDMQIDAIIRQIQNLQSMQDEVDGLTEKKHFSVMESYNNSKQEMALLNDILAKADDYDIHFDDVTKVGDQIRRDFALNFATAKYETAEAIINELYNSPYRCLIRNVRISSKLNDVHKGEVTVDLTATFYETMVDGTPDSGLPEEKPIEDEVELNVIEYNL